MIEKPDSLEHESDNDLAGNGKQPTKENTKRIADIYITVNLDSLVAYKNHPFQIYEGERLQKLADSMRSVGLQNPIIVRSIESDKLEILSGHNRVEAARLLGWNEIKAIIKGKLTDKEAEQIVLESNLNQQSFGDWKYSQQIRVISMYDKYIQENSRQGQRNDIREGEETCDHSGHKLDGKPRSKTRDKIAKHLGISSTVFTRYRRIAKLDEDVINVLSKALDSNKLGFMAVWRISQLKDGERWTVISLLTEKKDDPSFKLKGANVKDLLDMSKESKDVELPNEVVREVLLADTTVS